MTYSFGKAAFFGTARFCRMAAAAVALLAIPGCASRIDPPAMEGARDTGTFPNLNIPVQAAAPQFTDDDRRTKLAQLKDDQAGQTSKGPNPKAVSSSEIDKLARNHGKDTLRQIQGKCDPALDPTCK